MCGAATPHPAVVEPSWKTRVIETEVQQKRRSNAATASFTSEETRFRYKRPINIGAILTFYPLTPVFLAKSPNRTSPRRTLSCNCF